MTTLVTRAGKGSPLTNNEMDQNLNNLNDYKVEKTSGTGSAQLPSGTTAQRDGSPQEGWTRFNSSLGKTETYDGTRWITYIANGAIIENSVNGIGYGPGAGGTVTQATSKSTSVTLNKPCGRITTHNADLAAGARVIFYLYNSLIGRYDIVNVAISNIGLVAPDAYEVIARPESGLAVITIKNIDGTTYNENIGILFQISKGATS